MTRRPSIPEATKRLVRQRCCFGCVICGNPIGFQYDHILPYAVENAHHESNITLLCPNHHADKTAARLSQEQVAAANESPANCTSDWTANGPMHTESATVLTVGTNVATLDSQTAMRALLIDTESLLELRRSPDGRNLLSLDLRDENNDPVLSIVDNELRHLIGVWDSKWVGGRFTLHEAERQILLEILVVPPHEIIIACGRFRANGVEVLVSRDGSVRLSDGSNVSSGWSSNNVDALFAIGRCDVASVSVRIADPPRRPFRPRQIGLWVEQNS